MLTGQKIVHDHDSKGTVHLYNTFDIGTAKEIAKEITNEGGGRAEGKNTSVRYMGCIPPELFKCDPDLIMAQMAKDAGAQYEYNKYMTQFFLKNKEYRVTAPKKYF